MTPKGGDPKVVPIPPPTSLFPGVTGGATGGKGQILGNDLFNTLHGIASGLDVDKIFGSIVDANKRFTQEGEASIKESFGATGLAGSSSLMQGLTDYRLQSQKDLQAQLGQMSFQAEGLKMGGAEMLMNLATSFAPSAVVSQSASGPSAFSQGTSAATAVMMAMLMMCYVAASFWGWSDPRTNKVRYWINFIGPKWFRDFYVKNGPWIAKTPLRWLFLPLFWYILSLEVEYARV
jgi:hypothetical protein